MKKKPVFLVLLAVLLALGLVGCKHDGGGNIPVAFSAVIANGSSSETTTQLTLFFSQAIPDLSVSDITLSGVSGVSKGTLSISSLGPTVYTLSISGFTSSGILYVTVTKSGYDIIGSPQTVTIYYYSGSSGGDTPVTFSSVSANGSASQTTTQLTLTFSQAITGLSASDIGLTVVSGVGSSISTGNLSGSGPTYTLPISGFTGGGTLSVSVSKSGYTISGSPKTVTIYYYSGSSGGDTAVTLNSVSADGSSSETTTQLTLTFSQAITGLSAGDITLSGVYIPNFGPLSGSGPTYTLPISGFTSDGSLSVTVLKSGYTISGSPKTVTIYYYSGSSGGDTEVTFNSVSANGSSSETTTQLTLSFSQAISGLSADDITLSGVYVNKGPLSGSGPTYTLPISGFTSGGSLYVTVTKSGYDISGSPQTVAIYYYSGGSTTDYTGTYIGGLYNSDYSQYATNVTLSSSSINGGTVTISSVSIGSDNVLSSSGINVGTWAYVYSGSTKIGIVLNVSTLRYLVLGKTTAASFTALSIYGVTIVTSDMDDTYNGTLVKN